MQSTMMDVPLSVNHLLERAGHLFPTAQIVSRLPDKSLTRHSYREFYARTRALAAALLTLGLHKGERVATLCWNHHAHLESYFGIPAAGGVMHTLNLRLAPAEIGWIAHHADDQILIVDDVLLDLYEQFAPLHRFKHVLVFPFSGGAVPAPYLNYETVLAAADSDNFTYVPHLETDAISMCYTSGTTGRAKGVVYSHRSTILHTLVGLTADCWGIKSTDVILPVTPMFHANSWGVPYGAVMVGAKLVLPGPHLHAEDLLDLITLELPTMALGVPTIWLGLIQRYETAIREQPGRWKLPPGMRSMVGGAAVPEALIRAFAKHGVNIQQGWGMTETSPLCAVSFMKNELATADADTRYRRAAMAGVPVPLTELRIRTDAGLDAPWDGATVGEIQVRGPFITGTYYATPVTEDNFTADGWLRTGDVATVDSAAFLRITDRTKDLIKSGGEWISSVDLENALMGHPTVAEAAVIAIPDKKWSERPLAVVVPAPSSAPSAADLNAHLLSAGFSKWQLPERYELIAAIPRTSTGKFFKVKLREMFPQ